MAYLSKASFISSASLTLHCLSLKGVGVLALARGCRQHSTRIFVREYAWHGPVLSIYMGSAQGLELKHLESSPRASTLESHEEPRFILKPINKERRVPIRTAGDS